MQITHKLINEFVAEIRKVDKDVRLSAKSMPWQTESSLRPLHQLLQSYLDSGNDLPWAEVHKALAKIATDKKTKYKSALDVIEGKKDQWDFLKNRVGGFSKFSAVDFQEDITIPGRGGTLLVRAEGFAPGDIREIIGNLKILVPLIHQLASNSKLGPRSDWFAAGSQAEVQTSLENLDSYLTNRCTRLTFKRVHVGMRCDSDVTDPDDIVTRDLAGQVIPTVMLKGEDRPDFRRPDGYLKVPSGLKVFIGPLYFSVRNQYDAILRTPQIYRFMTLAHELTHKIIKTVDKVYELSNCEAIKGSPEAVMCADSWGYFITAYKNTPEYLMRHGAQSRRAAMGYDED